MTRTAMLYRLDLFLQFLTDMIIYSFHRKKILLSNDDKFFFCLNTDDNCGIRMVTAALAGFKLSIQANGACANLSFREFVLKLAFRQRVFLAVAEKF